MTDSVDELLRRSKAHLLVGDVEHPELTDEAEHHLRRVLRLRDGAAITVTDGRGSWGSTTLVAAGLAPAEQVGQRERQAPATTVGFAIPKQDRPEWIVQKLTEIGVARILVLHAERSVVRWVPDKATQKLERLRSVSVEALQQSRGVWLPELVGPVEALDVVADSAIAEPGGGDFQDGLPCYLIGPEGGWSDTELAAAASTFGMGETILRVETAALAVAFRALNVVW